MGQKTNKAFCKIPRDQMHEQMICSLKNTSGVINNLDDPSTVRRELVVCPEMARLIREFEGKDVTEKQTHHEQYTKFHKDYKVCVYVIVSVIFKFSMLFESNCIYVNSMPFAIY